MAFPESRHVFQSCFRKVSAKAVSGGKQGSLIGWSQRWSARDVLTRNRSFGYRSGPEADLPR